MKTVSKILVAAVAATLFAAGSAGANDDNTLYLEQIGDGNSASVHQSTGGGGNDIGTQADPVTQSGNSNSFQFSNAGCCNANSRYNNDVIKAEQDGDGNSMKISVWNLSNNDTVEDAQQIGDSNILIVEQNGATSSSIQVSLQDGNRNATVLKQHGAGNVIADVRQIGDDNGLPPDANGAQKRAGTYINQNGAGNMVQSAYLEGDNNTGPAGNSNTFRNAQRIEQNGDNNGLTTSVASTLGSDGSRIWVFETGNGNNFYVMQGVSVGSTGNYATVTQDGDTNDVHVTQFGDNNAIVVDQDGSGNTTTANFTGSGNGVGSFSSLGEAGLLAAANSELIQGTVFQDSSLSANGNTVSYTVNGDGNLFAFAQLGGNNTITGTVGSVGASNLNEVAVLQNGSSNAATFSQNGGSNNLAISQ